MLNISHGCVDTIIVYCVYDNIVVVFSYSGKMLNISQNHVDTIIVSRGHGNIVIVLAIAASLPGLRKIINTKVATWV